MDPIDRVFDRLDDWRHLPSYQLERRADIFFSLYLPEVLEHALGMPFDERLVPEFPVVKGALPSADGPDNRTFKIDYLARSKDGGTLVFVELKTDNGSIGSEQVKYLSDARDVGMDLLLGALGEVVSKSRARAKYLYLLNLLSDVGLGSVSGYQTFEVACSIPRPEIVYVRPAPPKKPDSAITAAKKTVYFAEFAAVVASHTDPVSQRFARSLRTWAVSTAGDGHRTSASPDATARCGRVTPQPAQVMRGAFDGTQA